MEVTWASGAPSGTLHVKNNMDEVSNSAIHKGRSCTEEELGGAPGSQVNQLSTKADTRSISTPTSLLYTNTNTDFNDNADNHKSNINSHSFGTII